MNRRSMLLMLLVLAPAFAFATPESRDLRVERRGAVPGAGDGRYGIIESIESSQAGNNDGFGGTVIGGVLGGIAARPAGSACGEDPKPEVARTVDVRFKSKASPTERRRGAYFIRVRLDDRNYQTVAQVGLDDLRVGDSVRIGRERVRRCDAPPSRAGNPADSAGR